jgi:hypothetical protein
MLRIAAMGAPDHRVRRAWPSRPRRCSRDDLAIFVSLARRSIVRARRNPAKASRATI